VKRINLLSPAAPAAPAAPATGVVAFLQGLASEVRHQSITTEQGPVKVLSIVPATFPAAELDGKAYKWNDKHSGFVALLSWPMSVDTKGKPKPATLGLAKFQSVGHVKQSVDSATATLRTTDGGFVSGRFTSISAADLALFSTAWDELNSEARKAGTLK